MIYGISAKAGSGKDEISNYVVKKYGFVKIAFADPIKRILVKLYNIDREKLWGESKFRAELDLKTGKLIRELIQGVGDKGRELYINTWVDLTIDDVKKIHDDFYYNYVDYIGLVDTVCEQSRSVIITDGRYLNELEAIKNIGGKLIRIIRPNTGLVGKIGAHASETDQDQIPNSYFDEVILNDSSIKNLQSQIDAILLKYQ